MKRRVSYNLSKWKRESVEQPDLLGVLEAYVNEEIEHPPFSYDYVDESVLHYIHFTDVEKLGVYLMSEYDTPLGIYSYPLSARIVGEIRSDDLPFAMDRKYMVLFRNKIVPIMYTSSDMTSAAYEQTISTLASEYEAILFGAPPGFSTKQSRRSPDFLRYAERTAYKKSGIGRLWNVTRLLASEITGPQGSAPGLWNVIMRRLGIAAVVDDARTGTIYREEPEQAVFFSKDAVDVVDIYRNRLIRAVRAETRDVWREIFKFSAGALYRVLQIIFVDKAGRARSKGTVDSVRLKRVLSSLSKMRRGEVRVRDVLEALAGENYIRLLKIQRPSSTEYTDFFWHAPVVELTSKGRRILESGSLDFAPGLSSE